MDYYEQLVAEYKKSGIPELVIRDKRVPHQWNTYSGLKRHHTKCVTYHNTGIDDLPAWNSWNYIKNYSKDNQAKKSWSATIDHDGSIWQHAEWNDLVWASGTDRKNYTPLAVEQFDCRPYDYDIPLEFCTINNRGRELFISSKQLEAGAILGAKLCIMFNLAIPSKGGFRRHYDFAKNKPDCPKQLNDPEEWQRFTKMGDDIYYILKEREVEQCR